MSGELGAFTSTTLRYIRKGPTLSGSRIDFYRWAAGWVLTIPFKSRLGAARLRREAREDIAETWRQDCAGRKVLIVGSGPSLDRADSAFFSSFDTHIHINFAIRGRRRQAAEYFFTTDLGPIRQYLDAHGDADFRELGPQRCVWAPIFLDQYSMLTPEGRALFTIMPCDRATWQLRKMTLGKLKLPLVLRYHPVQPDWNSFRLQHSTRTIPVIDHTSALSAILFAAQNGAREIGLIGCDFSVGRSAAAASTQAVPDQKTFAGAAGEFNAIKTCLDRQGVAVVNHSWVL